MNVGIVKGTTPAQTQQAKRFKSWAEGQGGEVIPETNEYEMARVKHVEGTFVIYQTAKRGVTFSDSVARKAWAAFKQGGAFRMTKRHKRSKTERRVASILERDGDCCFYCDAKFGHDTPHTLEHLLSIAHGGSNLLANLALACEDCNREAGSMDVVNKIKLRDRKRGSA